MSFLKKLDEFLGDCVEKGGNKILDKLDKVEQGLDKMADKSITLGENIDIIRDKDYKLTEKIDQIIENSKPVEYNRKAKRGDIIGVSREIFGVFEVYEHYGIFLGNNEVIHFTSYSTNDNIIMQTHIDHFLKGSNSYFVFNPFNREKEKVKHEKGFFAQPDPWLELKPEVEMIHYSQEETVSRAIGELGKDGYNLLVNNCEHFAIWCKTGVHKSFQVEEILDKGDKLPIVY